MGFWDNITGKESTARMARSCDPRPIEGKVAGARTLAAVSDPAGVLRLKGK